MKKLIGFIALVAMTTAVFGQTTSSDLLKKRAQEIQAIDKNLRKSAPRGTQIDPADRDRLVAKVDSFYQPLILAAMEKESATATPAAPTIPVIKKNTSYVDYDTTGRADIVANASSETPVNLPPPVPTAPENKRAPRGGNIIFQGANGGYAGRSSTQVAAQAYNSSRMTEAIATSIEQTTAQSATVAPNSQGYVGFVRNNDTKYVLQLTIKGVDNPYFVRNIPLKPGESQIHYLPAGNYVIQTQFQINGVPPSDLIPKFVGNPMNLSIIDGATYFWAVDQPAYWR
jgi:hypothetical protein